MKVIFNSPVLIDRKHFAPGEHTLSAELQKHWYVKALVKSEVIVPVPEDERPRVLMPSRRVKTDLTPKPKVIVKKAVESTEK